MVRRRSLLQEKLMYDNDISLPRIHALHPRLRQECSDIIEEIESNFGIFLRVAYGLRSFEEQDAIYQQGRTRPGPIVTWAKPGYSLHNYGLAIDFCLLRPKADGKKMYSWDMDADDNHDNIKDWNQIVETFESYGWESGMRWPIKRNEAGIIISSPDNDHVQKTFGLSIADCISLHQTETVDQEGYILIP
jgi:peptidoglycan L-alanyl-D-glutamate endopeptidase CwlK